MNDENNYKKIENKLQYCRKKLEPVFTDFIEVSKANKFLDSVEERNVKNIIFGGFEDAERVIICFYPDFMEPDKRDFPICVIKIEYNAKFSKKLSHRNFLGSLIGLGIKREKIGDICVNDDYAVVFVYKDISEFIIFNLNKVGSTKVKSSIIDYDRTEEFISSNNNQSTKIITVASLRVDAVLSACFNLSRAKICDLVKAEKVFINQSVIKSASKTVNQNDKVTLRGFGRIRINEVKGKSKKDRTIIEVIINK